MGDSGGLDREGELSDEDLKVNEVSIDIHEPKARIKFAENAEIIVSDNSYDDGSLRESTQHLPVQQDRVDGGIENVNGNDQEENEEEDEEEDLKTKFSYAQKYAALSVFGNFQNRFLDISAPPSGIVRSDEEDGDDEREEDHENVSSASSSPYKPSSPSSDSLPPILSRIAKGHRDEDYSPPSSRHNVEDDLLKKFSKKDISAQAYMTLHERRMRTKELKKMRLQLASETGMVDEGLLRLQHQLKMSNATSRDLDTVILLKHQYDINFKANQAASDIPELQDPVFEASSQPSISRNRSVRTKTIRKVGVDGQKIEEEISDDLYNFIMAERIKRAAVYVQDSINGKETVSRTKASEFFYNITSHAVYKVVIILVILLHMAIIFGEPPSYRDFATFDQKQILAFRIVELLCIVVYLVDISFKWAGNGSSYWMKSPSRISYIVVTGLILLDVIIAFAHPSSVRFSRPIRPLLLITKSGTLREISSTIVKTVLRLADLVFLVVIVMVTYGIVGVQLFYGIYDNNQDDPNSNFDNLATAWLTLFVLLTTENYPEVMIPAFRKTPWAAVYFITYLLIVLYLLMSVLTAVVLDTYKSLRKIKLIKERVTERKGLATAFQLLDFEGKGHIDYQLWESLIKLVSPKTNPHQIRLLFQTIDEDQNGQLNIIEFFELCDVLLLRFKKDEGDPVAPFPEKLRQFFNDHLPRKSCKYIIKQPWFGYITALLVLTNIIILCLFGTYDAVGSYRLYCINLALLCCFVVEVLMKLIGHGWTRFWASPWDRFDLVLLILVIAAEFVNLFAAGVENAFTLQVDQGSYSWVRIFNAISSLRVVRVVSTFRRIRLITFTVLKIAPLMGSVTLLVFCIFYFYGVIGVELMGDCFDDFPALSLVVSFSSFPKALLSLFHQLTESNWQDVMYYAMQQTTSYVCWYFITFNLLVVVITLNVLIALVIDTFVLQHEILSAEHDILLEIPDPQNETSSKVSKWHVWKELGRRWERELVSRSEVPQLKDEEIKEVKDHALKEIGNLKNSPAIGRKSPAPSSVQTAFTPSAASSISSAINKDGSPSSVFNSVQAAYNVNTTRGSRRRKKKNLQNNTFLFPEKENEKENGTEGVD